MSGSRESGIHEYSAWGGVAEANEIKFKVEKAQEAGMAIRGTVAVFHKCSTNIPVRSHHHTTRVFVYCLELPTLSGSKP